MKKGQYFLILVLFGLTFFNILGYSRNSNAATTDLNNFSISGNIPSGISNLYMTEKLNYDLFGTGNSSYVWSQNITEGHVNLTLAAIAVQVTDLRDSPYTKVITDDISSPLFAVPEAVFDTPIARMAQYFVLDNFSLLQKVRIYINANIGGLLLPYGHFQIDLYNATGGNQVNVNTHSSSLASGLHIQWLDITINEYLDPGEYIAVFSSWVTGLLPTMNNNSWMIHNYSSPSENKGLSLFENSSGWFPIPEDATADFLMELDATHYLSPYEVNLTTYINNETVQMHHNRDYLVKTVQLGRSVWRSEILYYLNESPTEDFNVTTTLNKTVGGRTIVTGGRYVYDEPTSGTYFANSTTIRWNLNYKKVNSSNSLLVFFKFPRDWLVTKLIDGYQIELIEYGILYSYIYGEYGNALWIEDGGDGTRTFEYSTTFASPNYLISGEITAPREVYVGDPFTIQATIRNSEGGLVTNGNCSFYLFNPEGMQIYTANVTNTNGVVSSDELSSNGWAFGTYSMVVVWSNGEEIGITIFSFEVTLNPLIIIAIIAIAAVAATAIVLTYGRRKLAERHWEKALHHLLVISKNGTPMYSFSFGIAIKDSALISGTITAITSFMKDATGSKKQLALLDQGDKKVILNYGKLTTVAILSSKDLRIIHNRAQTFIEHFEMQYGGKLKTWTGNTEVFKGANKIVEEHFPVSMDEILITKAGFELQQYKELIDTADDHAIIAEILSKVTNLTDKYQDIILKNYSSLLNEIINKAHTKLAENV